MSREWKPGDVAMVKNKHGVWNLCIRTLTATHGWVWRPGCADVFYTDEDVEGVRSLVVLDPDDIGEMRRFGALVHQHPTFADALREFTKPRLAEPSEWLSVVEDREGATWYRWSVRPSDRGRAWISAWDEGRNYPTAWHEIDAVKVVSTGVGEPIAEWEQQLLNESSCDRGPCALLRGHEGRCHA